MHVVLDFKGAYFRKNCVDNLRFNNVKTRARMKSKSKCWQVRRRINIPLPANKVPQLRISFQGSSLRGFTKVHDHGGTRGECRPCFCFPLRNYLRTRNETIRVLF